MRTRNGSVFGGLLLVLAGAAAVATGLVWLSWNTPIRSVTVEVKFTASPVQVRFFDGTRTEVKNTWSEWQDMPFPGKGDPAGFCQTGDVASKAQVRVHPGVGGVRLGAEAYIDEPLTVTVDGEDILTIEGNGKAKIYLLGQGDNYICDLVLTKR